MTERASRVVWVRSMYGHRTREPGVTMAMPAGEMVQMTPGEARQLGRQLVEAAEAAISDAFIVEYFAEHINIKEEMIFKLLADFREWRERRKVDDPPSNDPPSG